VLESPAASGNIAAMRNLGWRAARAPLVAFTDDDCRPGPAWLEAMLAAADGGRVIVQGRTEPDPDECHLLHGLARSQEILGASPWHETCNMLYPRAVLAHLDGFDERFASFGEDAELGLRAREAGVLLRYEDRALVYHAVNSRSLIASVREAARRDTIPALVARHPSQRRALWGWVFWQRSHALLLLAALGSVLARRRPVAALAAIPYIRHYTNPRSLRSGPRRAVRQLVFLGARTIVDSTEVAATAAAAIREREPVV
jgi:GT2 family glycosyltransferase